MTRRSQTKGKRTFDPDKILTKIHRSIDRDFAHGHTEYVVNEGVRSLFKERQTKEFRKKYHNPAATDDRLEKLTFERFSQINEHMSNFQNLNVPTVAHPRQTQCMEEKILIRARALMHWCLTSFDQDEFFSACKNGPGTTFGVSFADTSDEAKFTYPISCTADAKPLLEQYFDWDFQLQAAIEKLNGGQLNDKYELVRGSRATTVPKNDTIRRMIAIEPTGNMYLQQGLMTMMYIRMKRVGLDVATLPEEHKRRAREGSMDRLSATVDFSSASDCVSTELLRYLLPPKWFRVYDMTRCKEMRISDKWVKLNMSSTMGNAVTFPLETLIFWTLGHATKLTEEGTTHSLFPEWEDLKSVSVFGDDCIVPDSLYDAFVASCERYGFLVNSEKSFRGSYGFRESCGGDYLLGWDVRPYCVGPPTSTKASALEPWLYTIMNGVIKRYIQYFGPLTYVYDKAFFRQMFELFRENGLLVKVVPPDFPDDSGLKIAADFARFRSSYGFRMSPIKRKDHGIMEFNFCSFRYWKLRDTDPETRLAMWLKRPRRTETGSPIFTPIRRKGGYVVARGSSSFWTILDR